MIKELWWRHLVKTGTWRVVALSFIVALSYAVTGSFSIAASIGLFDLVFKSALYFLHEWVWSKIDIGREIG